MEPGTEGERREERWGRSRGIRGGEGGRERGREGVNPSEAE